MSDTRRPIGEDEPFQEATWTAQRIGWAVLGVLVMVGLLGGFGKGGLANGHLGSPDGLRMTYERIQRHTSLVRFAIRVPTGDGDRVPLHFGARFDRLYEISSIEPEPAEQAASPQGLSLSFRRPPTGELAVTIWARPRRFGPHLVKIDAGDAGVLDARIVILP